MLGNKGNDFCICFKTCFQSERKILFDVPDATMKVNLSIFSRHSYVQLFWKHVVHVWENLFQVLPLVFVKICLVFLAFMFIVFPFLSFINFWSLFYCILSLLQTFLFKLMLFNRPIHSRRSKFHPQNYPTILTFKIFERPKLVK